MTKFNHHAFLEKPHPSQTRDDRKSTMTTRISEIASDELTAQSLEENRTELKKAIRNLNHLLCVAFPEGYPETHHELAVAAVYKISLFSDLFFAVMADCLPPEEYGLKMPPLAGFDDPDEKRIAIAELEALFGRRRPAACYARSSEPFAA